MNKKGFTLIEILAVIVIIGITATIGIIAVSNNINKSRDSSVVDLAKTYAEGARTMKGRDDFYYDPKENEGLIIPYSQITGVDIENSDVTGYGDIVPNYCYVGVINEGKKYKYYVTQLDESYHFLDKAEYNTMSKDDILLGQDQLVAHQVKELKAPFKNLSIAYGGKSYKLKGIRVQYNTTFQQTGITRFDTKDFSGIMKKIGSSLVVVVEKSSNASLPKGTYSFTRGWGYDDYLEVWTCGTGIVKKIAFRYISDTSIVFDFLTGSTVLYQRVETTNKVPIQGYYTVDNSYLTMSAQVKGDISVYDTFATTGKFPGASNAEKNVINLDGYKYVVNSSELLYALITTN